MGSHLCDRLVADGNDLLCVDNFYTGFRENVFHLIGNPKFELLRHDITFPLYVEVDEIFNLACPASPIHYQSDPVQTTKTSVLGSINMLGLAKRTKSKIFSKPRRLKFMGIPRCTHKLKTTLGMLTQWAFDHAMMRKALR